MLLRPSAAVFLCLLSLSSGAAYSQQPRAHRRSSAQHPAKSAHTTEKAPTPSPEEEPFSVRLERRVAALRTAQTSGDPVAIEKANAEVLAVALAETGRVEVVLGNVALGIDAYKKALQIEDLPATHTDLAIAYLRSKRPEDGLAEVQKALFSTPQDARAWRVEGSAWTLLKDYPKAAEALAHAMSLKPDAETAYSLGTTFLVMKQKDKAKVVFQDMVNAVGDRGGLHIMFGRAYRDAEYDEDAAREFQRALQIDPKTPHAHYFLGLLRLMSNQWTADAYVRKEMLAEHELYPNDLLTNYLLGVFASGDKNYEESDRYLKAAAAVDPSWPENWLYLGLNANDLGDKEHAEEYLRKAIDLTGTDVARSHYQIRKAYFALGRILLQTGRREEGQKFIAKSKELQELGLKESQQTLVKRLGMVSGAVLPDAEPAQQESAEKAAGAAPMVTPEQRQSLLAQEKQLKQILAATYNDIGTSEARQRHYDVALTNFKEAEKWQPDVAGLMRNLGMAAAQVGDYADASRGLAKAVQANTDDRIARAMLGFSYYMTHDYEKAVSAFSPLGEQVMADPGVGYPWAESLAKTGHFNEAANVLVQMQKRPLPPDTLLLLGQTWSEIGDYQHALDIYHKVLEVDPSLRRAHYYSGLAYIRAEKPADAAKEFGEELKLDPGNADAQYHLGYALMQQNQRAQALEWFNKVVAAHPEHADAQYQLGKALLDDGKVKDAIAHLEAAAKYAPEKDYIHYQLQAAYRKDSRTQDADRELALYREAKDHNRVTNPPAQVPNQ